MRGVRRSICQGDKFGRFTIMNELPKKDGRRIFLCKCDCGNEKVVKLFSLTSGVTVSCACYNREISKEVNMKHGGYQTKLYSVWNGMKYRCFNPNRKSWKDYGGRGITICPEWMDFSVFAVWAMSSGYQDDLTIERKDNDGNYCPENCTWVSVAEQRRNTTRVHKVEFNGQWKTFRQWAEYADIHQSTLRHRLTKMGWTLEEALTIPVGFRHDFHSNHNQ